MMSKRKILVGGVVLGFLMAAGALFAVCGGAENAPLPQEDAAGAVTVLNIYTLESGVYELRASELGKAGMAVDGIDPANFTLHLKGIEWPLWYDMVGDDFLLRFYAPTGNSLYTQENVFLLSFGETPGSFTSAWDSAQDLALHEVGRVKSSCPVTIRKEENLYYFPQVNEGDHWFWQAVPAGQQADFELVLDGLSDGEASIGVSVWSGTQASVLPDHHVRVFVNEQKVADETWDGAGWHLLQAQIPQGVLTEGTNWVRLEAPGDTGAPAETNLLDWIEIQYSRIPVARNGRLRLQGVDGGLILDGFRGQVMILDVTLPSDVRVLAVVPAVDGKIEFWGQDGGIYYVLDEHGLNRPERIIPVADSSLALDAALGSEYLAIGPADLLSPLTPLLEQRAQQGLRVASVPVEAVYDQFSYGFPEPEAIRAFLTYLFDTNGAAPRFLLLVGDASYDPRGYLASVDVNRLPTFFVMTAYGGQTASDVLFSDLDGDLLPDLAVGRVPASSPTQVEIFVGKTLVYEDSLSEDWQRQVLAVADGQDDSFRQDAQVFLDELADPYRPQLFSPQAGVSGAAQSISNAFQEGYGIVAYFGHGSLTMWGKDRLFTVDDVGALENEHLPVVINMTCLAGLYTHPSVLSLAESMLWQPDGGAVAVLAPTSLTLSYDQSFLSLPLARALTQGEFLRLGDAYLAAQRQVPTNSAGALEVMQTFLLFGDPALLLPGQAP